MIDHVSTMQMEQFCARTLPASALTRLAEHLSSCKSCQRLFQETFQFRRGESVVSLTLAPEKWQRHEHLDYEQLVPYVENSLGNDDREIIDLHLRLCGQCREDVRSFQAYRQQDMSELAGAHISAGRHTWRDKLFSGWSWLTGGFKPVSATAIVVALFSAIILLALLFERNRTSNQQAQQSQTRQSNEAKAVPPVNSSKEPARANSNNVAIAISPSAANIKAPHKVEGSARPQTTRSSSPLRKIQPEPLQTSMGEAVVVALDDGQEKVVIDSTGHLTGLDYLPPETQQSIKGVLLTRNIERPAALSEIAGERSSLRGTAAEGPSFKLLSPTRSVVANDRPAFTWTQIAGATSYRVQVVDSHNHEVAKSGELPFTSTQWTLEKPLARGIVYTWIVTAVVDGSEVIAPSASEPEMKFKVLDEATLREINALRQRTRSHLALGIVYAKAGMRTEAEREFQILAKQNPNSSVAQQLLRSIQSWR